MRIGDELHGTAFTTPYPYPTLRTIVSGCQKGNNVRFERSD